MVINALLYLSVFFAICRLSFTAFIPTTPARRLGNIAVVIACASLLLQQRIKSDAVPANVLVQIVGAIWSQPWRLGGGVSLSGGLASLQTAGALFSVPSMHGRTNIDLPFSYPVAVERKQHKHVFMIWLEGSAAAAWPWTKESVFYLNELSVSVAKNIYRYCQMHNCADIPAQYDTPEHMTPFFQNLTRGALRVQNYAVNVAFSVKSDHTAACGNIPPSSDFTSVEHAIQVPRPCLPHILANNSYSTAYYSSAETTLDNFDAILQKQGWQDIYGLEKLVEEYPATHLIEPRLSVAFHSMSVHLID